jgi:hypothetical protein
MLFYEIFVNSEKKGSMNVETERNMVFFIREVLKDLDLLLHVQGEQLGLVATVGRKQKRMLQVYGNYFFRVLVPVAVSFTEENCKIVSVDHGMMVGAMLEVGHKLLGLVAEQRHMNWPVQIFKAFICVKVREGYSFSAVREQLDGDSGYLPKMAEIKTEIDMANVLLRNKDLDEVIGEEAASYLARAQENPEESRALREEYRRFIGLFFSEDHEDEFLLNHLAIGALIASLCEDLNSTEIELNRLRIMTLKSIIETVHEDAPVDAWDPEIYEQHKVRIIRLQDELVDLGAADVVVKLSIDYAHKPEISNEIKLLGIALLFGGNPKVQAKFLEAFRRDEKNLFLKLLFDECSSCFGQLEKHMKEVNGYENKAEPGTLLFSESRQNSYGGTTQKMAHDEIKAESKGLVVDLRLKLRLMQLLCEGHNLALQEYLCQQDNATFNQVNFTRLVSEFYNSYYKFINQDCVELGEGLTDFLVECVQGPCRLNQKTIVDMKLVQSVNDFLGKFMTEASCAEQGVSAAEVEAILAKSVLLLNSLLEGNYYDLKLIREIYQSINIKVLLKRMETSFKLFKGRIGLDPDSVHTVDQLYRYMAQHFDEETYSSFNLYIFIQTLSDRLPECRKAVAEHKEPYLAVMMQFYKTSVGSIEVNFQDQLIRIYFPIHPICSQIEERLPEILDDVPRENIPEKQAGFLKKMDDVFERMEHFESLSWSPIPLNSTTIFVLLSICNLLVLFINILIVAQSVRHFSGYQRTVAAYLPQFFGNVGLVVDMNMVILYLGIAQISLFALILWTWVVIEAPLVVQAAWRAFIEENIHHRKHLGDKIRTFQRMGELEVVDVLLTFGPASSEYRQVAGEDWAGSLHLLYLYSYNFYFCVSNPELLYYLFFYLALSVLGLTVSQLPYSFLLVDIVAKNETVRQLVRAVTKNGIQIWATIFLTLLLNYLFGVIAFFYFNSYMNF